MVVKGSELLNVYLGTVELFIWGAAAIMPSRIDVVMVTGRDEANQVRGALPLKREKS